MNCSIPIIQVRSKCFIQYYQTQYTGAKLHSNLLLNKQQLMKDRKKAYSGKLTDGAKKRLRRAIELLCMSNKPVRVYNPVTKRYINHRLSFITLTVSQTSNITAQEAYQNLLVHFLQWMRRTKGVTTYVWKAEVQQRGQIHYHITTPSFIHYKEIREKWNNLQSKAGYLKEYYEKTGHYDPNSTDIHQVRHVKDLSSYLMKEFAKSIQNPNTDGKVWDCSLNLKACSYYSTEMTQKHREIIEQLQEEGKLWVVHFDRFSLIQLVKAGTEEILNIKNLHELQQHMNKISKFKESDITSHQTTQHAKGKK